MNVVKVIGTPLYQWESGRKVQISPHGRLHVTAVHFSHVGDARALVVDPIEENGMITANVPNVLLQSDSNIVVYVVDVSDDRIETLRECVLGVRKRAKPSDYVYTETEVLNYSSLDKRLKDLEGEGLAKAIADYFTENPVQTGATEEEAAQIEQNKQDIASLTEEKLSADKLPEVVNDALAQAKASGEFDGQPGANGEDGKDGYTPVKGVDYFDGKDGQNGNPGKDGVSATHSWNGTVLTVTSASGTSSANLKGEKGEKGDTGATGAAGKDGETPVKGVDYWTSADQEQIVQDVITALPVAEGASF